MTATQLALDCEPHWNDEPTNHTPTPTDLRQHEIRDCRGQAASPLALWTATTITAEEYL